jgi:hypothetical protein
MARCDEQPQAMFKTRGLQLCHRRVVRIELAVSQKKIY